MMLNLGMKTWAFSGELKQKKKELEARIQQILLPKKDRVGVKFQFPDSRVIQNRIVKLRSRSKSGEGQLRVR